MDFTDVFKSPYVKFTPFEKLKSVVVYNLAIKPSQTFTLTSRETKPFDIVLAESVKELAAGSTQFPVQTSARGDQGLSVWYLLPWLVMIGPKETAVLPGADRIERYLARVFASTPGFPTAITTTTSSTTVTTTLRLTFQRRVQLHAEVFGVHTQTPISSDQQHLYNACSDMHERQPHIAVTRLLLLISDSTRQKVATFVANAIEQFHLLSTRAGTSK